VLNAKPDSIQQAANNTPVPYVPGSPPGLEDIDYAVDSIVKHDSWSMSFIDLLTLLLALFVLLLSFKNDGNPENIPVATAKATPQTLTVIHSDEPIPVSLFASVPDDPQAPMVLTETDTTAYPRSVIEEIVAKLTKDYDQQDVAHKDLHISSGTDSINLEISEAILFAPASDKLTVKGNQILEQLAGVLVDYPFRLSVEGHTDNVPINSAQFPSNWELSAARATRVTRRLIDNGFPAASIRSIGYGDTRPIATNDSPEGRARNRRVSIVMDLSDNDVTRTAGN